MKDQSICYNFLLMTLQSCLDNEGQQKKVKDTMESRIKNIKAKPPLFIYSPEQDLFEQTDVMKDKMKKAGA